jgi:hypothetical protein
MNATTRIKRHIMSTPDILKWIGDQGLTIESTEDVEEAWDKLEEVDARNGDEYFGLCDLKEEFRCGGEASGIPSDWDRHYESESRAQQLRDDSWVGWTYWYGGGKHSEPQAKPWLEEAYTVTQSTETRTVNVFTEQEESES